MRFCKIPFLEENKIVCFGFKILFIMIQILKEFSKQLFLEVIDIHEKSYKLLNLRFSLESSL